MNPGWVWLLLAGTSLASSLLLGPLFDTHRLSWRNEELERRRSRWRAVFWSGLNDLLAAQAVGWLMGLGPVPSAVVGCSFCALKTACADGLVQFVHEPSLGGYSADEAEGDIRAVAQMGCSRLFLICALVGVLNTWVLFVTAALVARLAGAR